ncbi:MAG: type II secretion system F family protein, partial [Chloroflexi bacterium]|nr:type II secretion system F family protein [Chloroflexota bacterium]
MMAFEALSSAWGAGVWGNMALQAAGWIVALSWVLLLYFLITLPMRRQERALIFVHILEAGLHRGRAPEETAVGLSDSGTRSLGRLLHRVADHLDQGMSLAGALRKVPWFLPPQVTEMLAAGETIGQPGAVLPACRKTLTDAASRVRGALHYLVLMGFGLVFVSGGIVLPVLAVFIVPKFIQMAESMGV